MKKSKIITIAIAGLFVLSIILMAILSPNDVYVHENAGPKEPHDTSINKKINVDLYIECSGSMHGYMNNHNSKFKDAINGCLSLFNATNEVDNFRLYYIGRQVHAFDTCFKLNKTDDLLQKYLNPSYFGYDSKDGVHKSKKKNPVSGVSNEDHAYSKLSEMLDTIIGRTKNGVSVFVSDCILDPYDGQPENYLTICETDIFNLFHNKLNDNPQLAVQIIQLDSKFTGNYYIKVNNDKKETIELIKYLSDVNRPYYVWIIGNTEYIAKFNDKIDVFKDYNQGDDKVINNIIFTPKQTVSFEIENKLLKVRNDIASFEVIADFSKLLGDKDSLNCEINSGGDFEVKSQTYNNKTKEKTFKIELKKVRPNLEATIVCRQKKELPTWVGEKNGDFTQGDEKIEKTIGIKQILNGISRAYETKFDNVLLEMNIKTSSDRDIKRTQKSKRPR